MDFDFSHDQLTFARQVADFAASHVAAHASAIDESGKFPSSIIRQAAPLGLMGVTIPSEWGGAARDYVSYALAEEALARASAVVAVIVAAHNSLVVEPIAQFGSDGQKAAWLRRLATGAAIGAFALSEEQAGSDAGNQKTVAQLDGSGYVLNGRKVWVANAAAADVAIVFAATPPVSAGSAPGVRHRGISAFLVPLDTPGVTRIEAADSLGVRGLGCMDLELIDVRLAPEALLGAAGDGFHIAMWALDGGRVAIAAQALGVGQAALDEALAHAKTRETFGQPIANYQAIQWMLADTATELDAARVLTWKAADAMTRRKQPTGERGALTRDAAMAKLLASEAAHRAADRAMQILASKGYRRGSVAERLFRDARAAEIYQGTSEIQRMIIAEHILA